MLIADNEFVELSNKRTLQSMFRVRAHPARQIAFPVDVNAISIPEKINPWTINKKFWLVFTHARKIWDRLKEIGNFYKLHKGNDIFASPYTSCWSDVATNVKTAVAA